MSISLNKKLIKLTQLKKQDAEDDSFCPLF